MGLVPGFLVLLIGWVVPIACSYFAVLGISAVCLRVFPQFFCHFNSWLSCVQYFMSSSVLLIAWKVLVYSHFCKPFNKAGNCCLFVPVMVRFIRLSPSLFFVNF